MIRISLGQAILILLADYKENNIEFRKLAELYLEGLNNDKAYSKIAAYLSDPKLKNYFVSLHHDTINKDPSRRYFETNLALLTLKNNALQLNIRTLRAYQRDLLNFATQDSAALHYLKLCFTGSEEEIYDISKKTYYEYRDALLDLQQTFKRSLHEVEIDYVRLMVSISITGVSGALHTQARNLPLQQIYGKKFFGPERGRVLRNDEDDIPFTNNPGLMRSNMPMPLDELRPQVTKTVCDQATFDIKKKWCKDYFKLAVHPFSNSISGTVFVQLRHLLRQYQSLPEKSLFHDGQEVKNFLKCFISTMLYIGGGHSIYEFCAPLTYAPIFAEIKHIPYFANEMGVKDLFLIDNEPSFFAALKKTIKYNKHICNRMKMLQNIQTAVATGATHAHNSCQTKLQTMRYMIEDLHISHFKDCITPIKVAINKLIALAIKEPNLTIDLENELQPYVDICRKQILAHRPSFWQKSCCQNIAKSRDNALELLEKITKVEDSSITLHNRTT
jgi:hypothetical protein